MNIQAISNKKAVSHKKAVAQVASNKHSVPMAKPALAHDTFVKSCKK